jgi:hypothetical protein
MTYFSATTLSFLAAPLVLVLAPVGAASLAIPREPISPLHAAAAQQGTPALDYQKIALDWATAHGIDAAKPETVKWDDVARTQFVHGQFGLFDVCFPPNHLETDAENLKLCVDALVDAQAKWLDWVKVPTRDQKALREDIKVLDAWVKSWKSASLAKAKDAAGKDLFELMGANEAQLAAGKRFAASMLKGEAVGGANENGVAPRIVLAPTRKEFVELSFFCGWIDALNRAGYWQDAATDWLQCFIHDDQIISLQYSVAGHAANDYTSGDSLNARDPNVMQQQIVQLATQTLLLAHYKERVPNAFIGGLAMNLVIEMFEQVNTRVDGDTRSKVAQKREVFVPGGNPDGGFLPKNSADTKWRENAGKDHFVAQLRIAQKDGEKNAKDAKNKPACFALRSDDMAKVFVVQAPFMGSAGATTTVPPADFQGDYAEMLRAYKSAFIYWLQAKSGTTEKVSREKFAELLGKLADPKVEGEFEDVFKAVFDGAPLSSPGAEKDSLEGKFLIWLSKQK